LLFHWGLMKKNIAYFCGFIDKENKLETNSKTTIYLARHGQTVWNLEKRYQGSGDSPLTELGIKQANLLAKYLENIHFDIILTSPAGRAIQTAEILKGNRNNEIIVNKGFAEINVGPWEGKYYYDTEIEQTEQYKAFWNSPHLYRPEYGESFAEVAQRTFSTLKNITKEYKGKTILIVSHAIAIKSLLNKIEGRKLEDFWKTKMFQTSLSIIEVQNGTFSVVQYGSTEHLEEQL
jgi:broad specificity phosphatase PhoE